MTKVITKKGKSGGNIVIQHDPALLDGGRVVSQFSVTEPGSLQYGKPWNAIMAESSTPSIQVLENRPMSLEGAEAMMAAMQAVIDWVRGVPETSTIELVPTSATIPDAGGNDFQFEVQVTEPGKTGWEVVKDPAATWMTLKEPLTPQNNGGFVKYQVDRNSGAQRTGTFTVNDKTFTVTQGTAVEEAPEAAAASHKTTDHTPRRK